MHDHSLAIFVADLIVLLACGRALGEVMNRLGQPSIFGQLLAGVLLGPSVFGALLPSWQHTLFPGTPVLKSMMDAISQTGILFLLLLTGMETNLQLLQRRRNTVVSTTILGISVPFVFGAALAYGMPDRLLPDPSTRFVTMLFLGTALSISSVKIVAMVLMEVDAIRRDLGQLILAAAVLDDTLAWVMIAIIAGIASHGFVDVSVIAASLASTALFLAVSLTIGRRLVAFVIRWTNDNMTIEVPVITAILVIMLAMALSTELIGVHTALGAFIAGLLIGQSPILTEHIEGQLKGLIVAFFSPVFFSVAGLGMDVRTLLDPTLLLLTLLVIAVASIGKFTGALLGGRIGGLTTPEALALATGLNARGSTEVIVASIGLSMGAFSNEIYTMVVAMAIVTTMAMPPTLRWALARVPIGGSEAKRLEKENAEEHESVPQMERSLVLLDGSANGALAASLAGMFAVSRQVVTTVMVDGAGRRIDEQAVIAGVEHAAQATMTRLEAPTDNTEAAMMALGDLIHPKLLGAASSVRETLEQEATKGYGIAFVGINLPLQSGASQFDDRILGLSEVLGETLAIAVNGDLLDLATPRPLRILVPTSGKPEGRLATEIALALAAATQGNLTALHVHNPDDNHEMMRGRERRSGLSVLVDVHRLGKRSGVPVKGVTAVDYYPERAILRTVHNGDYDLIVIGTSLRVPEKFLGSRSSALLRNLRKPVLLVIR